MRGTAPRERIATSTLSFVGSSGRPCPLPHPPCGAHRACPAQRVRDDEVLVQPAGECQWDKAKIVNEIINIDQGVAKNDPACVPQPESER